ncbi:homoserine dehydrogenase [candidate division WOR-3 bacterium]|nr:homoserine dehydrogenase [candidate division WOR-3 bacterium]
MQSKLAIVGLGTVGKGLIELLYEKSNFLSEKYHFNPTVVAISDPRVGSLYNESGLDLKRILSLLDRDGNIKDYPDAISGWDSLKTIKESNADTIIELTPTNLETGEPGLPFIRTALKAGKDVVTTNKGPIALAYRELQELANENNCMLRFEGTVIAGTPALNLALSPLAGINITEVRGIVNGTTNYILTRMESGMSYEEALKEAQLKGYAEAIPDADVKGWDAVAKIIIIANVLMGGNVTVKDVEREGIDSITLKEVEEAAKENKHWKLIGRATKLDREIKTRVSPEKLDEDDPLSQVAGATNAICFTTDILGDVTIIGPGAGKRETGFAILSDLLDINRLKEFCSG